MPRTITSVETAGLRLFRQMPGWAASLIVHIVALLGMALLVIDPPRRPAALSILVGPAESEEEMPDFDTALPPLPAVADPVPTETVDAADTVDLAPEPLPDVLAPTAIEPQPPSSGDVWLGELPMPQGGGAYGPGRLGSGPAGALSLRRPANVKTIERREGTEGAVDRALKWFIAHQMPDGGWSFDLKACPSCQGKCSHGGSSHGRCAATAMALLPFLGRGYTHKEGPYKSQLESGIAFLAGLAMKGQGNAAMAGGESGHHGVYAQGLAGICLSEAYAMTQDNRLQQPAQYALNCIMDWQDLVGGGWGYQPKSAGDTSILGWQLMALKSGNMAYLQINHATIKNAIKFLDSVEEDSGAFYGYRAPGKGPGTTAIGLLCRMYLGWKKDNPALERGVEFFAKKGPTNDLYYDYYATQIMHHMEGDVWQAWNAKMKKMLLDAQAKEGHDAGSWFKSFEGGHGPHKGGRLYCTSLATMILEVYYRHLPIYRNQATDDQFFEE